MKTKLAVKDGQSIMIGGLITRDESYSEAGIPLLMDLPVVGNLFKTQSTDIDKKELLIMVTPYVIETEDVLDQYIKQFDQKMNELRDAIYEGDRPVISNIEKKGGRRGVDKL
jgi:general secretion pathway protein D